MTFDRSAALAAATIISFAAAAVLHAPLHAQAPPPSDADILRILEDRIEAGGAVGVAVGVLEPEGTRFVAAGRTGGEGSPTPDAGTLFEIGSIAKVFTALLLAEMAARGEVELEAPMSALLPESVNPPRTVGREITLLDLATHASGLPAVPTNMEPPDASNPYEGYGPEELYRFLDGYTPRRAPGEAYEYSNLGVGLLGHLLSLRAGIPYEDLVTERILEPLGMHETVIRVPPRLSDRLARGHGPDLEPVPGWDFDVLAGAGAWRSTTEDMLRFLEAVAAAPDGPLGDAILSTLEPRRPTGTPNLRIGLAWHVFQLGDRELPWHNGQTGGFHAFAAWNPASGSGVVVLANSATDIDDLGLHLLEPAIPLREVAAPREAIAVDPEVLETYLGRYQLTPEFTIEITLDDGALFARATGQSPLRMEAATSTRFFLRAVDAEIEFTLDDAGRVTGLVLHQGGAATPGRRVGRD